jgi:hypothetical protein
MEGRALHTHAGGIEAAIVAFFDLIRIAARPYRLPKSIFTIHLRNRSAWYLKVSQF